MFRLCEDIDKDWDFALQALKPAFCRSFTIDRLEDYYLPLKEKAFQLWIAEDEKRLGAVVTSIDHGSNGSILQVRYLGGSRLRKWAHEMDTVLTHFAKRTNCRQIESLTRKGFFGLIKTFKPQGLDLYVKVI